MTTRAPTAPTAPAGRARIPAELIAERPRVRLRDLLGEAAAAVTQRPLRSVLTGLGAAIGVCVVVIVLGLTATASAQVNARFDALRAREITVTIDDGGDTAVDQAGAGADASDAPSGGDGLTTRAAARVRAIPGVVAAGTVGSLDLGSDVSVRSLPLSGTGADVGTGVDLRTVDAAAWNVLHPRLAAGRLFDVGHQRRADRVAVLGTGAARRLGITRLDASPAVFVDGVALTVIGVVDDVRRDPGLLGSVILPTTTAAEVWGTATAADAGRRLLVETRLGAAGVVAARIPLVVDPAHPQRLRVKAPPDPKALGATVGHDLDVLSLTLAAVSVLLAALGISNTMLVTVMERTHEIGLRRALGAGGGQIAIQFLVEAAILGGVGGLVGSGVGVAVVVSVALVRDWTPVIAPWVVLAAPALGLCAGLLAGVVPAVRAARIQPADALRR